MNAINSRFFKDAIRDKKLSIRGLSTQLGMNHHSQLSLMLSGKRRMQLDEAIRLSQILGIPLNEIIANAGFPEVLQDGRRVPVVGILRGTGEVEPVPPHTERAVAPVNLPDNASAIQARTADTPLQWLDRAVFFCGEQAEPNDAMLERLSHIKIKNGPAVIGMLRRGYVSGSYSISGPYSADSASVEWVAPIIVTRH